MNRKIKTLSIVVPVLNEEECVAELVERIGSALESCDYSFELIIVDDGSTDGTIRELEKMQAGRHWLRIVQLRRNFGQTAAIAAGFDHAKGDVIVPLDGDLQNDPIDIPRLLEKLEEGYDVVSGWRKDRKDVFITRKLPSMIANGLIGAITGVKLHDYGCTLKAYHRDVVDNMRLYGEMHRFIPAIASWSGAKVAEIEVTHHPRLRGKSKYGLNRTVKVLLDLITVKFLGSFSTKPLHIFGTMGLLSLMLSFIGVFLMLYQKYRELNPVNINRNPILTMTAMLMMMSVQFFLMGLLAEMMCRTYHESQDKPTYIIRRILEPKDDGAKRGLDGEGV